jgi:hypothetical protein
MAPKPNSYEKKVKPRLKDIIVWRGEGATQNQIAGKLGLHVSTLYKYAELYPELADALSTGRKMQTEALVGKLYELAMGQAKTKTKETITRTDKDGNISIEVSEKESTIAPDKGAALNLLANLTLWQRDGYLDHWLTDPDAWDARMKELAHKKEQDAW